MLFATAVPGAAQPPEGGEMPPEMAAMMQAWAAAATPGEPHAELAKAAGTWKMTVKFWMEPGGEPMVSEATATRQMMLGGRYLQEKVEGVTMGQPFEGFGLSGYDNVRGKYWSIWMDNMSTGTMTSEGEKDASGAIVFHGSYPDAMTKGMTKVKTILRRDGDDKESMEMWEEKGGQQVKTMELTAVRQ
jgi:hypothetical protein